MVFGPEGTAGTLQYLTRFLVGDPSTAASEQWALADIKMAINKAYLHLRDIARSFGLDATSKRSFVDGVADQIYYQRPDDLVKLTAVEVSGNGSNLSSAAVSAADILYPKPWPAEKALQWHNQQIGTDVGEYFFLQDDHFGIVAPLTSTEAGTKTIRILYEASTTELSADGDVPEIFLPYHDLICYQAAITLKLARELDARDLAAVAAEKEYRFRIACQDAVAMYEDRIPVQGERQQMPTSVVSGSVKRVRRGAAANDVYP